VNRYLCVHGHFYQPPRENPWLEAIELQDSAYPYHDWNERITSECYAPNASSRILDDRGRITAIVNNYARISFNFGPTLLAWLEAADHETYRAILDADRLSRERLGHGSAMAQAYNHMIMPLASTRDKRTQIVWGIHDFESRFGREPDGMWLPETAVDTETLDLLAEHGIRFTILAPNQASRVRPLAGGAWEDVAGSRVDPTMPYTCRLPSGREIALFFYDGPVSRAIAFEGLLNSGEAFAGRLVSLFDGARDGAQLVHIATDGETYGHHHRLGEMGLSYALHRIEQEGLAELVNYARFLELYPPRHEAEIIEDTAWSCAHGVDRWRADCGCSSGMNPDWNQAWRAPLREALDRLRDDLEGPWQEAAGELLADPWAARDDYACVILDRSFDNVERYLDRHARRPLSDADRVRALELLELQRHGMLMYTSCGWFFDDLGGIETVQVIQYAGRAIQLAEKLLGGSWRGPFVDRLARAHSNVPASGDGRRIFERFVEPASVDLAKVGAHYAMSSLFEEDASLRPVYCYLAEREEHRVFDAGRARLAVGRARITSSITRESALLEFGVVHLGDHNLNGGIRPFRDEEEYGEMMRLVGQVFATGEFASAIRWLDGWFGVQPYSLKSLFRDEQRKILDLILDSTLAESEAAYRQLYENHAPLMRFLAEIGAPLPKDLRTAAEMVLNLDLRRAFEDGVPDPDHVRGLFEGTATWLLELDVAGLAYALKHTLERLATQLLRRPRDQALLWKLEALVDLAGSVPFDVDLWRTQNAFYGTLAGPYPEQRRRADAGDAAARDWLEHYRALGEKLSVHVP
jgi:alpha-amylase/alpha-mannosidase (GH57 family)